MGAGTSDISESQEVDEPPGSSSRSEYSHANGTQQARASPSTGRLAALEPQSTKSYSSSGGAGSPGSPAGAAQENAHGVKLMNAGHYDDAVRHFKQALAFEPNSVQILDNIGLAYAKRQDFSNAYEWYEKAHRQDPRDVETLFSLAWVERKRQRYVHARELFMKVLQIEPEHTKALWLLGDVLKTSNDIEGAKQQFEKLIRIQPGSADGHVSLAQCYEGLRLYPRAIQIYNHLLQQVAPGRVDVHFALGKVHFHTKQYRQAIAQLERVPETNPRGFEARTLGAKAYRELEDHERAIGLAESAARIRPHQDVMHFLGEEYIRTGDPHKASLWFGRALDLDPNHAGSLMELGQLMYRQNRWQEAERHFTRLCERDQTDLIAVRWLALVKYKLRKDESCRQCCEALIRSEPLHVDALWLLSELQVKNGSTDDRWFLKLKLPAEVSTSDVCQCIAKGYLVRKQVAEAGIWLQRAQSYFPSDKRLQDAQQLLSRKGAAVNPQDVLDILEQKSSPVSGRTYHQENHQIDPVQPARTKQGGYPMQNAAADAEELERLLRRAEPASRTNGDLAGAGSADQWKELLASAKTVLRRSPQDALALRCAARALLSTSGDPSEIREYARKASEYGDEAAGFTLGYEIHAYLGTAAERERNFIAAEKHFAAALSSKAGDESAMLGLARTLLQRKDKEQAKKHFQQVAASHPNCVEAHAKLAEIALEADDASEAYRLALQASKLAPSDGEVQLFLGRACLRLGKESEAVRALDQAATLMPNCADVPSTLALAGLHRKAGRDQDAIACYKRVLDLRPGDYECTLSLAQLYASRGAAGASQAIHYFRSSLQYRPSMTDSKDIYLQMATVQCAISAFKDAQQTLEGAARELPSEPEIWRKLFGVHVQLKDTREQHRCYQRLVQLGANTPTNQISYSELLLAEGKSREAKDQLQKVLKTDPANVAALLKLGDICRSEIPSGSNLEEARRYYEQVLELNPSSAEALEGAATCHRKANNLQQAIELYQQCLKIKPNAEGPLYYLGDILYRQHHHAGCQLYLARLLETSCPVDFKTSALYLLCKSHLSLDEYEDAEKQARAGLALEQNNPHLLFMLALVMNRMTEYDSSITSLKKALQYADPGLKVEIHDWLAQAYERKQQFTNAKAELDMAFRQEPNHASSFITQGLVYIHLNELEKAETSFRKALAVEKNHALALVRLGYCKLLENDISEAMLYLERALQQRCGTVALPRSVKGTARVYMALALMAQQDMDRAVSELKEARKSHRNFEKIHEESKDSIVKGDSAALVRKLRDLPDLDVNDAQAWKLVELMAKEFEIGFRDSSAASRGTRPGLAEAAAASPPAALFASSDAPQPGGHHGQQRHSADTAKGSGGSPSPNSALSSSPAVTAAPERRQWTSAAAPAEAAAAAPERRQWTSAAAPAEGPAEKESSKKMLLSLSEQIDFSELTQNECLGAGGFGAVYRGYYENKEVAIKRLFCEDGGNISGPQLEELEKEIAALRGLNHPRLVGFIGACLTPPNLCIITEFMPGGSLHHLLHKAKTPLTVGQQAKMACQICEGVCYLHSHVPPVVHRDLKSLNIVLDRVYNAKICDFGLTQSMELHKTHISLKEGGAGGSPRYMAPECYDCKGKITEKVDMWALGCIIIEAFGGPLPYDDCNNMQQIVAKVLIDKEPPYIPNHLPKGVRPIVEDCLQFDIKQRATAQTVYSRMKALNLEPEGV
eukprot:TRINITY_DN72178_c0_g1_i1.p1 TRINITY_DN72178_c0_g1~~TRINITY_DN72178_c0_g1_i1.p1  ORF type:complete len:1736 (-),score=337.57 TRINITY_DN72178_c0_g1_i1:53-5203(-)